MINKKNYIFIVLIIVLGFFLQVKITNAANLKLVSPQGNVPVAKNFPVDVFLDPENTPVNAFDISIILPEGIFFKKEIDNDSIVGLWIKKPEYINNTNTVNFSGIIPGGFSGLIDPFHPEIKQAGKIIRLYLFSDLSGDFDINIINAHIYANDGSGSEIPVTLSSLKLTANNFISGEDINFNDNEKPLLFNVILSHDDSIENGKYVLIFDTKDKISGISHYEINENNNGWQEATSPYVLNNQKTNELVLVKAVDNTGNEQIVSIQTEIPVSPKINFLNIFIYILIIIIAIIVILLLLKFKNRNIKRNEK